MKLPLSWIKEYVEIKESPEKLSEDLQFSGTKVESVEKRGDEVIFDFEITPNRPDCLGVIGIAREVTAIYKRVLTLPPVFSTTQIPKESPNVELTLANIRLCPSYSLGIVGSVDVDQSPKWMKERLEDSGIRSLNNIVDITNYVMLETGQPMHAFDSNKIKGGMNLRSSKKGERLVTLDGIERKLPEGSIIIEDREKLIDLAGLMGGEPSEIDKSTENIILHVPVYNPLLIRRTSQALGLRTEASGRFEKLLDPAAHRFAFERAVELIRILAGGKLVSSIKSVGYPTKERFVNFETSLVPKILGIDLSEEHIKETLGRLEFTTHTSSNWSNRFIKVGVPSFRTDIHQGIDLTEEVGRMYGYNNFPKTLPKGRLPQQFHSNTTFENKLKQTLTSLGLSEIYGNPLTSGQNLGNIGIRTENCLRVQNRLAIDYEYLRPSLLVSLFAAVAQNQEINHTFSLFELGTVFEKKRDKKGLPYQPKKLGAIFAGYNFPHVRGILETVFQKNKLSNVKFVRMENTPPFGNPTIDISIGNKQIGIIGNIASDYLTNTNIDISLLAFELNVEALSANSKQISFVPTLKLPTVKENISLFVPDNVSFEKINKAVKRGAGTNLYSIDILEDTLIKQKRALLLGVEYFDPKKTLDKKEITIIRSRVLTQLENTQVQIRSD